jgi:hypothetical protein
VLGPRLVHGVLAFWMQTRSVEVDEGRSGRSEP